MTHFTTSRPTKYTASQSAIPKTLAVPSPSSPLASPTASARSSTQRAQPRSNSRLCPRNRLRSARQNHQAAPSCPIVDTQTCYSDLGNTRAYVSAQALNNNVDDFCQYVAYNVPPNTSGWSRSKVYYPTRPKNTRCWSRCPTTRSASTSSSASTPLAALSTGATSRSGAASL